MKRIRTRENAYGTVMETYANEDRSILVNIETDTAGTGKFYLRPMLRHASSGYRIAHEADYGQYDTIEDARADIESRADQVIR